MGPIRPVSSIRNFYERVRPFTPYSIIFDFRHADSEYNRDLTIRFKQIVEITVSHSA